jgi:ABC-type sugar transport system permease subunit
MSVASGRRRGKGIIYLFLAPAVLLYSIFFIYPAFDSLRISMYDWAGLNIANAKFIGLRNFAEAFDDRWVRVAVRNNFTIMLIGGVFMFALALLFAMALTQRRFKAKTFFRTVIFFPYLISGVGVGLFWIFVFNPQFGILNGLLRALGLEFMEKAWLGDPQTALACVIFVIIWWGIGFYMLFLVAGIETIPPELFDAARVDGANERQLFFRITLPLLREFLSVAVVIWMIDALREFAVVLMLTGGGPGNRTTVLSTYMAKLAFNIPLGGGGAIFRFGYGASIAVILFVLVLVASLVYFRLRRKEAIEY